MIQGISPAISAVKNLGKRIGNVANNVANVATSGYKKSRSTASSLPGYNVSTASGISQVGMGLGNIVLNALEMSNVDLVEEFTKLILFKRSFQANLKVIEVENELKGDVLDIVS